MRQGFVHWEDPEGSDGEGGGRGGWGWGTHVNPWLIHVNVWQKPLQYCKGISLQLINEKKKERMARGDLKPRRIRAESHVKEAEMGMMSLQAKECQGL